MKLDRAWPLLKPVEKVVEKVVVQENRVWPKSLKSALDQTVERSLGELLKESFPETEFDESDSDQDPKQPTKPVKHAKVSLIDQSSTIWIAFGVLAFVIFMAINNLHQKIATLESWLHGRMMSSH
jgi:hypothetical protein